MKLGSIRSRRSAPPFENVRDPRYASQNHGAFERARISDMAEDFEGDDFVGVVAAVQKRKGVVGNAESYCDIVARADILELDVDGEHGEPVLFSNAGK